MEIARALLTSSLSIIILFILSKLMGNRQIAQLTMFDYIVGITIGSIASEMAVGEWTDMVTPIVAMVVYTVFPITLSYVTSKSIKLRRILTGETLILMDHDKIYKGNLKKAKMDLSEFLSELRNKGFFDLSEIETVILEPNGNVSIMPRSIYRPITPNDMAMEIEIERPQVNVILDGKILEDNLKFTGNNHQWLEKQLHINGIHNVKDVLLATCDFKNNLTAFLQIEQPASRDIFE